MRTAQGPSGVFFNEAIAEGCGIKSKPFINMRIYVGISCWIYACKRSIKVSQVNEPAVYLYVLPQCQAYTVPAPWFQREGHPWP